MDNKIKQPGEGLSSDQRATDLASIVAQAFPKCKAAADALGAAEKQLTEGTMAKRYHPHFKHAQIVRLARLLDMLYKPSEIAEELDLDAYTIIHTHIASGCPHSRDSQGRLWINGLAYKAWAQDCIGTKKGSKVVLLDNQAYCLKCRAAADLINPTLKKVNKQLEILQAVCPVCGSIINRARKVGG